MRTFVSKGRLVTSRPLRRDSSEGRSICSTDRHSDPAAFRVDMHAHILPPPFMVEANQRGGVGWTRRLPELADCVAWMHAYNIDATVLSLPAALDFGGDLG